MDTTPSNLTLFDVKEWKERCCEKYQLNGNLNRFYVINKFLEYIDCEEWMIPLLPVVSKVFPTLTEEEREKYINTIDKRYKPLGRRKISDLKPREEKHVMDRLISNAVDIML